MKYSPDEVTNILSLDGTNWEYRRDGVLVINFEYVVGNEAYLSAAEVRMLRMWIAALKEPEE